MDYKYRLIIYLFVLSVSILCGIYRLRNRDNATKTIILLLSITLISEYAAHQAALQYGTNMFVYHFFAPLQLIFVGKYFDQIANSRKRNLGVIVGLIGAAFAIINGLFFQPLDILNSNFLLFEGLIVMGLALYTFQNILTDNKIDIYRYEHFWIVVILIFFWSITYIWWALYTVLQEKERYVLSHITKVLWSVNVITYAAIGFVLLYFSGNRKQLIHE